MRNRIYIFYIMIVAVVVSITECTAEEESYMDRAIRIATNYKTKALESEVPANMDEVISEYVQEKERVLEPFTSTVFLEKQMINRFIAHGPQLALIKQSEVKVSGLEFSEEWINDGEIELEYKGDLIYGEESLELKGTITLLKLGGGWIVNNDIYNMEDLIDIINSGI